LADTSALGPFIIFTLAFLFEAIYVASRRVPRSKLSMSLLDLASLDADRQGRSGGRAGWVEGTRGEPALLDEETGFATPRPPHHKEGHEARHVELYAPLEQAEADAQVTPFRPPRRREYRPPQLDVSSARDAASTDANSARDVSSATGESLPDVACLGVSSSGGDIGPRVDSPDTRLDADTRSFGAHSTDTFGVRSVSEACPTYDESMAMAMGMPQPKAAQIPLSPLSPMTPGGLELKRQIVDLEHRRPGGSGKNQGLSLDTRLVQAGYYQAPVMTPSTPTASPAAGSGLERPTVESDRLHGPGAGRPTVDTKLERDGYYAAAITTPSTPTTPGRVVSGHDLKQQIVDLEHRRQAGGSSRQDSHEPQHSPTVEASQVKQLGIDKPQPPLPGEQQSARASS
jgi:hypothetical protein